MALASGKTRVLMVDDDENFRASFPVIIASCGFAVWFSSSVTGALGDGDFDVAVIDYLLEDGNGLDLIRQLKEQNPKLRTILYTGYDVVDTGDADLVLKKPSDIGALIDSIRFLGNGGVFMRPTDELSWEFSEGKSVEAARHLAEVVTMQPSPSGAD